MVISHAILGGYVIAGNEFAIGEMEADDLNGLPAGKGRCFEAEPTDLPMGNFYTYLTPYDMTYCYSCRS